MSAFEVDNTHIDVMVSAALQRVHGDTLSWYHGELPGTSPGEALPSREDYLTALKAAKREVTSENAETWGATLLAENRRSVNHRYDEDEIEAPYTFTEYSGRFDPAKMLGAIACYEYQSCEHPGWETSEAKSFCDALRHRMIHMLPGYDSPHVTDPAQVFIGQPSKMRRPGMPRQGAGATAAVPVRAVSRFGQDERAFTDCDARTLIEQVGKRNILAISGGRVRTRSTGITLPVSNGYSVTIDLAADDTYTVRRVFKRGDRTWIKGERAGVHCDELSEAAYQASCFRNVRFGKAS